MAETRDEDFLAGPEGHDHGPRYTNNPVFLVNGEPPSGPVYTTTSRTGIGTRIAQYVIGGSLLAVLVCSCAWLCAAILSAMPRIQ